MPTLNWIGKEKILNHHNDVPFKLLNKKYFFGSADSANMIIHGDNLYALKALLPQFEGRINCIYIDPPYNTGNEGWVYNDNVNDTRILKWLGQVVGAEGEDLSRHDKWLCMMYPRLRLLQKLLSDDGMIFISIDDNEQANLKIICDEIFGSDNFVIQFAWQKTAGAKNNAKLVSSNHEYVLMYAKNKENLKLYGDDRSELAMKDYKNPDNDPRGVWSRTSMLAPGYTPKNRFTMTFANGKTYTPDEGKSWRYSYEKMLELEADNRVSFEPNMPRKKTFLSEVDRVPPKSLLLQDVAGNNQQGTTEIQTIFGDKTMFTFPKPVKLVKYLISKCDNKSALVLDCFAGSGTTGHAVAELNLDDGGNRKFIEIEMMDYAETVTAERLRKLSEMNLVLQPIINFSYYELGEQLVLDDGNINPTISSEDVRRFIYYTETHKNLGNDHDDCFMGIVDSTAFYVFYEKSNLTCLNFESLRRIDKKADSYIVYADTCTLSKPFLEKNHIIFKKIPRDIQKF